MANPIDELFIAITADTEDAVSGIEKVDTALKKTEGSAGKSEQSFSSLKGMCRALTSTIAKLSAVLFGTATAFRFFNDFIAKANNLEMLGLKTGVAASELDAWSRAAEAAGGSAQALQQSLASFYAKTGREATEFFKLGDKIEGMSQGQKRRYLKAMGVELDAIPLFLKGRAEISRLVNRYRQDALDENDIRNARQFKTIVFDLQNSLRSIGTMIARAVLPAMTSLNAVMRDAVDLIRENSRFFAVFSAGIAALAVHFLPAIKAAGLALVRFGVASATALAPVLLFVAGIAALALAVEDLYVFGKGGESWIGRLLGDTQLAEETRAAINSVIDTVSSLWDTIKESGAISAVFSFLVKGIALLAKAIAFVVIQILSFITLLGNIWSGVKKVTSAIADFVGWLFSFDGAKAIVEGVASAFSSVGAQIDWVLGLAKDLFSYLSDSKLGQAVGKVFNFLMPSATKNAESVSAEQARYSNSNSTVNTNAQLTVNNNFASTPANAIEMGNVAGRSVNSAGSRLIPMVAQAASGVNP